MPELMRIKRGGGLVVNLLTVLIAVFPTVLYYLRPVEDVKSHVRYHGELLGIGDPQNRDPRRKPPPETKFSVGLLSPPLDWGC